MQQEAIIQWKAEPCWYISQLGGQYTETSGDLVDDIIDGDGTLRLDGKQASQDTMHWD